MAVNPRETMKKLNSLYKEVDAAYMRIAAENGLSFNALMMLYLVQEDEKLTQKKVCGELYLPKSSVHSILADLRKRGLLMLTGGDNKKEKYIIASPEGQTLIRKIVEETDRIESGALLAVSEREMTGFLKTADKLAEHMTRQTEEVYGGRKDES